MESYIPLERQFSPLLNGQPEDENSDIFSAFGRTKAKSWDDLEHEYRCVILAEAGAGKTEEFQQQATVLKDKGKPSFFIRIEDIEADFYTAFEVGSEELFQSWLQSTEEAWFFLDSVDEARLGHPRTVEKALRRFASTIKQGAHRAHIYLSSRPYAWRPEEDRRMFNRLLFLAAQPERNALEEDVNTEPQSTLYTMLPLDKEKIRRFCEARAAKEIDRLLQEIERTNLWSLAERPFDLENILAKWDEDNGELGGRLELLHHNIEKRLRDDHNTDRAQRQQLNIKQAREGAGRLAAAVILTGTPGLNVPDKMLTKPGIKAEAVLADWNPKDVHTLLERGIFNDVIYGAVRFRHREIRELLATEWFAKLLEDGNSRTEIEKLFFRDQYGEKIITPRLRPVLPWLILFDNGICHKALAIQPEIAVEGGDPSQLPLPIRQKNLSEIVRKITLDVDGHSARDNSAIARIANPDLAGDAKQLISEFADNDDAIFFLGRLVWQGKMTNCVAPLVVIAVDGARGIYARIASVRAVMSCGSAEQKKTLWNNLNESDDRIPRELLAELLMEEEPDSSNVEQLIVSLGKLSADSTGLNHALDWFVERLPVIGEPQAMMQFLNGINGYLDKQPYIEDCECDVSEEYAWLLTLATHAIGRLVKVKNSLALRETALSILLNIPVLHVCFLDELDRHKDNLQTDIPAWPELNDTLYWACIEQARRARVAESGKSLTDDWSVSWLDHFWSFDINSLPRLCDYMNSRTVQDDRLVALSTAFRVYVQADKPAHLLSRLREAVTDDAVLQKQLEALLNPPVSKAMRKHEQASAERQRKRGEEKEQRKQAREAWIKELCADPDRVCNPPNLTPGELTDNQYRLMNESKASSSVTGCAGYANWQALIPDFGDAVARTYRDATITHWRCFVPAICSYTLPSRALIFAMAGLEIESTEVDKFPTNLNEAQVCHALRYITWGLNGLPSWLERMHHAFPVLTEEAVLKELLWELEHMGSDNPPPYILHDLVYSAAWLHAAIAPTILKWLEDNPTHITTTIHYCIHILVKGETDPIKLASLAKQQIENINDVDSIAVWYALRVDCDPIHSIPELEQWLAALDKETATRAAQIFITTLMGEGRSKGWPQIGYFCIAEHLKALYLLMHRYIPAREDINRAGGGVYSPGLRDDAQSARSGLFSLLSKTPGQASYSLIKQLAHDHPDVDCRPWMAKQAYKRAEEDGNLQLWTAKQVNEFDQKQTLTPETHHQLFDLTVNRLQDLKNWLECGNDSPWKTWRRAGNETEMRTLIAGWLNQKCCEQYVTAEEPELANSQRMDIWLRNTKVKSPVPIELKLLDKGWSGPKLCERLNNQLAGDYLREKSAACGVMLLVWQGNKQANKKDKRWIINGRHVGLSKLACALKSHWLGIADQFPNVESIEVVVIDLTERERVSVS